MDEATIGIGTMDVAARIFACSSGLLAQSYLEGPPDFWTSS